MSTTTSTSALPIGRLRRAATLQGLWPGTAVEAQLLPQMLDTAETCLAMLHAEVRVEAFYQLEPLLGASYAFDSEQAQQVCVMAAIAAKGELFSDWVSHFPLSFACSQTTSL